MKQKMERFVNYHFTISGQRISFAENVYKIFYEKYLIAVIVCETEMP